MRKQRGFTLIEALTALIALTVVAGAVFAVFVLSHFISKFW